MLCPPGHLVIAEDHRAVLEGELHAVVAGEGDDVGPDLLGLLPVDLDVLGSIAAAEGVDQADAHPCWRATITFFKCSMTALRCALLRVQRVRIVAEGGDLQALLLQLGDNAPCPAKPEIDATSMWRVPA